MPQARHNRGQPPADQYSSGALSQTRRAPRVRVCVGPSPSCSVYISAAYTKHTPYPYTVYRNDGTRSAQAQSLACSCAQQLSVSAEGGERGDAEGRSRSRWRPRLACPLTWAGLVYAV